MSWGLTPILLGVWTNTKGPVDSCKSVTTCRVPLGVVMELSSGYMAVSFLRYLLVLVNH